MTPAGPTSSGLHDLLRLLGELTGGRLLLWRGDDLSGRDVDLLLLPGAVGEFAACLRGSGWACLGGEAGRELWHGRGGPPLDVLHAAAWPREYPALTGLASRAELVDCGRTAPLPVASGADRLLVLAAEAVNGRPLDRIADKATSLLAAPGAGDRLAALAAAESMRPLAALVAHPERLRRLGRRGRLPYPHAAFLALRCRHARSALVTRLGGRLGRRPKRRRRRDFPVVTLSGMDGAGKSTAAELILHRLAQAGVPAKISWGRLGSESRVLTLLAAPVKRVLRRSGTVADPVAAGGPRVGKLQDPAEAAGRRRLISWIWIVIVAMANTWTYHRAVRDRRRCTIVCDRWVTDALVDLELRYGNHSLASAVLRFLCPSRDAGILLEIDAETAAARKPEDQAQRMLRRMEELYAHRVRDEPLLVIDVRAPRAEVERRLAAVADALAALAGASP